MARSFPNKFAADCAECGQRVPVAAGLSRRNPDEAARSKWLTSHKPGECPTTAPGETVTPAAAQRAYPPTAEQAEGLRLVAMRENVVMQAGAGTGKTSWLLFVADWAKANGLTVAYRAFNRRIVDDTARKAPGSMGCKTMHSDALAALPHFRPRLSGGAEYVYRQNGAQQAALLGINPFTVPVGNESRRLAAGWIASRVMGAVRTYCRSADDTPGRQHIAYIDGIDPADAAGNRTYTNNDRLADYMMPFVQAAWADLSAEHGNLRFGHDCYLKIWSLGDPIIQGDILAIDEAQDTDAVQMVVVRKQIARGMQVIGVGDDSQTLYEWRGAVNALAEFEEQGAKVTFLTQSFRFGDAVAEVANGLLGRLGARLRLRGHGPVASTVGPIIEPDAILCRTNAGAIRALLSQMAQGRKAALLGNSEEIAGFMRGAIALQDNQRTDNPELAVFDSWTAVQEYVNTEPEGQDLKLMVKLVDEFGAQTIIDAVNGQADPDKADVVCSTGHKTKGLEWNRVQVGTDWKPPAEKGADMSPAEMRLAYVVCTRAKLELDITNAPHFAPGWSPA